MVLSGFSMSFTSRSDLFFVFLAGEEEPEDFMGPAFIGVVAGSCHMAKRAFI